MHRSRPAILTAGIYAGIVLCACKAVVSATAVVAAAVLESILARFGRWPWLTGIYNRLARAAGDACVRSQQASADGEQLEGLEESAWRRLASHLLALIKCTLNSVGLWFPALRARLPGDPRGTLAGRAISSLVTCGGNSWVRVESVAGGGGQLQRRRVCCWRVCRQGRLLLPL